MKRLQLARAKKSGKEAIDKQQLSRNIYNIYKPPYKEVFTTYAEMSLLLTMAE